MKKVMCFGTFDLLHKGHLSYLEQSKKLGDKLIVIVARDKNVFKIKGRYPREDENKRLKNVRRINFVDEAVLGRINDRYALVKKNKPDIICLGYDQQADIKALKEYFKCEVIRMKPFKKNIYKSSKINV